MVNSGLFEGVDRKYFSYDIDFLSSDKYQMAGRLIALSLKYNSPGPRCLHPAVYSSIVGQPVKFGDITLEDLCESPLRTIVQQVRGVQCCLKYNFRLHRLIFLFLIVISLHPLLEPCAGAYGTIPQIYRTTSQLVMLWV